MSPVSEQVRVNNEVWERGDFVGGYATRLLRPVEVILLARYRDAFSGRVLELGCGAGRISGYVVQLGGDLLGVDLSERMVAHCGRFYPEGRFQLGNLEKLAELGLPAGSFDLVLAGNNLVDVLDDESRRRTLAGLAPLLSEEGLLVFSSHNRGHAPSIPHPVAAVGMAGTVEAVHRALRLPWWIANRRRLQGCQIETPDYAVLNDEAHDYRLLHYYISRDDQERQLSELGYGLLECLDEDGRVVQRGENAASHGELHYVCRVRR